MNNSAPLFFQQIDKKNIVLINIFHRFIHSFNRIIGRKNIENNHIEQFLS